VPEAPRPEAPRPEATRHPPVVSVLMPFLNVAPYLADAIESVRAQTYPHWELLLVDDGSTDGSGEIARRYAALDPRVRALEHPGRANLGASASRNLALRHATGAYVALLDGDDLWLPPKLEEQVALLEATPAADVLVGSTEFWYSWTGRPEDTRLDHVVRIGPPHGTIVPGVEMLAGTLEGTIKSPGTCSLIARREAFLRAGGFEDSFRRVFTDLVFWAKLLPGSSVLVMDTCWDRYRRHDTSSAAVATRSGELVATRLRYLQWLRRHLRAHGIRDRRMHQTVTRAIWQLQYPRAERVRSRLRQGFLRSRWAVGRMVRGVLQALRPT
jgi:glycosyltransferase involved in cell wall biosynthesis